MEKAQGQHWYVVYTKRQREDMAQAHLQRKGFDTFFPRLRLPHGRRDRRPIVPLFPNYFFARLRLPDDYNVVRWTPGVNHVVGYGGNPTPLDETVVEFLRQKCTPEGLLPIVSELAPTGIRRCRKITRCSYHAAAKEVRRTCVRAA